MRIQHDAVFRRVCEQLVAVSPVGQDPALFHAGADLLNDLALDSLRLVDLTVLLESALELPEFPMQVWIDTQLERGRPLTVGELVAACCAELEQSQSSAVEYG
jgi:acyl carrier protein